MMLHETFFVLYHNIACCHLSFRVIVTWDLKKRTLLCNSRFFLWLVIYFLEKKENSGDLFKRLWGVLVRVQFGSGSPITPPVDEIDSFKITMSLFYSDICVCLYIEFCFWIYVDILAICTILMIFFIGKKTILYSLGICKKRGVQGLLYKSVFCFICLPVEFFFIRHFCLRSVHLL